MCVPANVFQTSFSETIPVDGEKKEEENCPLQIQLLVIHEGDNVYMVYLFILSRDLSALLQMKDVFYSIARQVCMKLIFHKEMLIILILP